MAKMTVYHGGYISVENPQVRIGRNTKDFGTGFYCTVIKEQAQRWAKRYDTKVVSIYEVRLNLDLNIKEFQEMTEEWLDFIIDCRSGKSHNYDIVIGAMADDQIYNYIADYIEPYRNKAANLDDIRHMAFTDIDMAAYVILDDTLSYIRKTGRNIDTQTVDTYEYYKGIIKEREN